MKNTHEHIHARTCVTPSHLAKNPLISKKTVDKEECYADMFTTKTHQEYTKGIETSTPKTSSLMTFVLIFRSFIH